MAEVTVSYSRMLKTTADTFRLGMEGLASENLIKVIDVLAPIVQDPAWPNREALNRVFAELLDAQSSKNYLRVADILEYELSRWAEGEASMHPASHRVKTCP